MKVVDLMRKHKHILKHSAMGLGAVVVVALIAFLFLRTASAISFQHETVNISVNEPFTVELNQSLKAIDVDSISIEPAVKGGEWIYHPGGLLGTDTLVFEHDNPLAINTEYTVNFGDAERYLMGDTTMPSISFKTEKAPRLAKAGVATLKDGAVISADYLFVAKLESSGKGLRTLTLKTDPVIETEIVRQDDSSYTWRVKGDQLLPQGQTIRVEVYDEKNKESLLVRNLKVADEPTVQSMVKADHFGEQDQAVIEFNQPIAEQGRDKIVFDLEGSGTWESDTKYVFTPSKVEAGKTYTYHIQSGLRSTDGGILASAIDSEFKTVGAVAVTASSPTGKELSQAQQNIKFTFDQPVDHASAEGHFSISSGTVIGFSWSGNTMTATVKNLGFQQTITARVDSGVVNGGFGLPSTQAFSVSFTTEIRTRQLGVPMMRQEHAATCGLASLRMALAYYGISTSEMAILGYMNYAPRDMDVANNEWDDPREMFVGNINGTSMYTASGVEMPLVARVARSFGKSTTERIGSGVHVNWIAEEIHAGHPVVISGTGTSKKPSYYSWTAPNGRVVTSATNGHARVVTGVKGEPSQPIGFWINDPLRGTFYWTASQLQANLRTNPYGGMAVSIY